MTAEPDDDDFYDAQSEASLIKVRIVSKYFEFWTKVMKGKVPRLAYIDSDPTFTQVKIATGEEAFARRVAAHDVHFTFGESPSPRTPGGSKTGSR